MSKVWVRNQAGSSVLYDLHDAGRVALQVGADPSGVTDSRAAFVSAIAQENIGAGVVTVVTPGVWNVSTPVAVPFDSMVQYLCAQLINGGTGYANLTDASPFLAPVNAAWVTDTEQPADTVTTYTVLNIHPTGTTTAYQKSAGYFVTTQNDPSSFGSYDLDGVALTGYAVAGAGNAHANLFGANFGAIWSAGTNGTGCGLEVDVFNNTGADATSLFSATTKTGISSVAGGSNKSTSAFMVRAQFLNGWKNGYVASADAITDFAFRLVDNLASATTLFGVDAGGAVTTPLVSLARNNPAAQPAMDASNATLTIANGGNTAVVNKSGLLVVNDHSVTGDVSLWLVDNAVAVLVSTSTGAAVAPTAAPPAGKYSVTYAAGVLKLYNNQGGAATFGVALLATR